MQMDDRDRHNQRQGARQLLSAVVEVCSGVPRDTLVVVMLDGDRDEVTPGNVRTFDIATPTKEVAATLIDDPQDYSRLAMVALCQDRAEAALVTGMLVTVLGLPASRMHVGPEGWSQLDGLRLTGPLEDVYASAGASRATVGY